MYLLLLSLSLSLLFGDDDDELIPTTITPSSGTQLVFVSLSLSLSLSLCFVFNSLLSSAQITQQNATKHFLRQTPSLLLYMLYYVLIVIDDANVFSISFSEKSVELSCKFGNVTTQKQTDGVRELNNINNKRHKTNTHTKTQTDRQTTCQKKL